jgi:hypothetical protein
MEQFDERQAKINALKQLLVNTDYKLFKAMEGHPSADWDEVKAKREAWREEVNDLEAEIAAEAAGAGDGPK